MLHRLIVATPGRPVSKGIHLSNTSVKRRPIKAGRVARRALTKQLLIKKTEK